MTDRRIHGRAAVMAGALAVVAAGAYGAVARGDDRSGAALASPSAEAVANGKRAFETVAKVLLSPRCMNCHPAGDRPLQGDVPRPHAMNVSRESVEAGLECTTCHRERNSEAIGVLGGPPGAKHWGLPPKATPMIFEGRTARALCEQLGNRDATGGRELAALLQHVSEDSLVLWAWNPGRGRSKPPVSHEAFVAAFRTWVDAGGACP